MKYNTFCHHSRISAPAEEVFAWHARPGAIRRLLPPWQSIEIFSQTGEIENGARAEIRLRFGPFHKRWIAEHCGYQPPRQFQDVQIDGPFTHWQHTHSITPDGSHACQLEDKIEYALPLGVVGRWLGGGFVRRNLQRVFHYRHQITANDIAAHSSNREVNPMKVLVSGSTGLVGSMLVPFLTTGGHEVYPLVRRPPSGDDEISWNPATATIDREQLEGLDAVVHLAGEGIASRRWTVAQKALIRDSRIQGTRLLCEALAGLKKPPKVFVCASAIGYYGDRGGEMLDESSESGDDYLADVCREWEAACEPAREKGIRVVNLRTGVVLSPRGGALQKMLLPFKLGVGGVVGDGKQYWSWIAIDDLIGAIHHAVTHEELSGAVNAVAPHPPTNREFTKLLGKVLRRPTIFPMPAFAARLALGGMADSLLLASARVLPKRLQETGYEFQFPDLEGALRHLLGR